MEENELEEELLTLEGFVTYYKFENESNGYRIASFKLDDNKQERTLTIVGYFPHFSKEDAITIKGKKVHHPKYGIQIEVMEAYKKLPTSKENIIRFLCSSQFKGVGKKCATAIFDFLKEDAISTLINQPDVYDDLIENKIITEKQKESLQVGLKKFDYTSNAYQLLLKYGFSLKNIMKAESTYGEELERIIQDNPYQLVLDIDGIGFKTIDKLALNMGFSIDDPRRVKACILYTIVSYCHASGDTYTSKEMLYQKLIKNIGIEYELYEKYIHDLIVEHHLYLEDEKLFHESFYDAECCIASHLKKYIDRKMNVTQIDINFDSMIKTIEEEDGILYSDEQLNAIHEALCNGIYIISGGPGTGKTTILNAIIKMLKLLYGEEVILSLCAPTGRASKRMSMLSNHYACTIHRLLKWDLHSNTFMYNENNKLHTDVIIIDEFSMVDTLLFASLLRGVIDVSQIILIGDDGQIPSVGAGNLLYDFLQIESIKHITLNHIYRQSEGSEIVSLAYLVRNRMLNEAFTFQKDTRFVRLYNYQAPSAIIKFLSNLFAIGYTFDDVQVIVPMYGGVAGIDNINATIQEWYNPMENDKVEIKVGHQTFRIHDRVLQLKNQPEDDIFNGDIGVIVDIDLDEEIIVVEFDSGEVIYPKAYHSNLTLAYAISVHKAQGSEFNIVAMCIFKDYGMMLNKQLIYTALTRAKKSLLILGDYHTFLYKSSVENKKIRQTMVKDRIAKILS